ncbi:MAG: T9SS type A sorting domain-containing protein [Bacteroidetes bacterium]|nr:T9SS type A sorting domain-containing protein [Bacteroidota bacterium]
MSHKYLAAILLFFLGLSHYARAQTITTIAGNGNIGYSGDSNLATQAQLNALGVALARDGQIYIPDAANNRVRKINLGDSIFTIAGTGTAGYNVDSGEALTTLLYNPTGVAVDTAGNLYIADQHNQRIRKVDTAGIMTVIAGTGITGFSGDDSAAVNAKLNNPIAVATDTFGNIFVVDYGNNRIRKINAAGIISTVAGTGVVGHTGDGGPAIAATLDTPTCVVADPQGNLYIADRGNNCIRKVDTAGIITNYAGSATGSYGFSGDGGSATAALLAHPYGVALDQYGHLYIADEENQRIRMINGPGNINTIAGSGVLSFCGDGGDPLQACLNHPKGVAVSSAGDVYVADAFNNRIRKITGLLTVPDMKRKTPVRLYPNPAENEINVEANLSANSSTIRLLLLDMTGRLIAESHCNTNNGSVATQLHLPAGLPAGIYLIRLTSDKEEQQLLFRHR